MLRFRSSRAGGYWVLCCFLWAACCGPANASDGGSGIVIDLDSLAGGGNPAVALLEVDEHRFSASLRFHTIASPASGQLPLVDDGSPYIASLAGELDGAITLRRLDGLPFSLTQLDGAEAFLSDVEAELAGFPNARRLRIEAELSAGGQYVALFDLDGLKDGAGGIADFQTFTLPSLLFGNITSATFAGVTASGDPGAIALDNLHVGDAIPEPATSVTALVTALLLLACRTTRCGRWGAQVRSQRSGPRMTR